MRENMNDRESHIGGEAEGRCSYSGDSFDDNVVCKRRKVQCRDEQVAEHGVTVVGEGDKEEFPKEAMQQSEAELYGHGDKVEEVGKKDNVGQKEKEIKQVGAEEVQEQEVGEKEVEETGQKEEELKEVGEKEGVGEEGDDDDDDDDGDHEDDDDGGGGGGHEQEDEEVDQVIHWGENGEDNNSSLSNKLIKEELIDRLSALPDSLLIHILSFLTMREAMIASVLSARWRFLWTELPILKFRTTLTEPTRIPEFLAWVHRALVICSGTYMQEFEAELDYYTCFASDVDVWLAFLVKNKVKRVSLYLNIDYGGEKCRVVQHMLPQLMYSNSSLTHLNLRGCIINNWRTIEWGSLTHLHLDEFDLGESEIRDILSGCPVLYDLNLRECCGDCDYLDFNSQSLHVLTIQYWDDEGEDCSLTISAPYVHSLTIRPKVYGRKLRPTNISPLVRVKIDFWERFCANNLVGAMSQTNELFESLQHVKDLEVEDGFIEVLSMLAVTGWRLPKSERECLTIHTSCDEYCIPAIVCLLESSPNLKTFTINSDHIKSQSHEDCFPNGLAESYFKKADLSSDLLHLKTVNIKKFANPALAGEPMLTMAQFLLKRATVLEKMVIEFEHKNFWIDRPSLTNYVEIPETLLSYERSSPKAVVLLV